jgi:hypothetical protein
MTSLPSSYKGLIQTNLLWLVIAYLQHDQVIERLLREHGGNMNDKI